MNLVMMDVFPTDWSPKKTNLYLANGASDDDAAEAADGRLALLEAGAFMEASFLSELILFFLFLFLFGSVQPVR
jgi:hypothetical protein